MAIRGYTEIVAAQAQYEVGPVIVIVETPLVTQLRQPEILLTAEAPSDVVDLRARLPARLILKGPADLNVHAFALHLIAQPLVRNLNRDEYQTVVGYKSATEMEFRLAETTYVDEVQVLSGSGYTVTVVDAAAKDRPVRAQGSAAVYPVGMPVSTVRVSPLPTISQVAIQSPSSASAVLVTLEDGTPLQAFPALFDPAHGVKALSRDLAAQINQAWKGGGGQVVLMLTSQTDGRLRVTAEGAWHRRATQELSSAVNPLEPVSLEVPLAAGWQKANLTLTVDGKCAGGLITRMGPAPSKRQFAVQVTESLHVAQSFRLYSGTETPEVQHLSAVWLCLPAVPEAAQTVELRLATTNDEGQPDQQPLAAWPVKLPVDGAAYVKAEAGYWFRAAPPKPVALDGVALARRLCLAASGQGAGARLRHQTVSAPLPADAPGRQLEGSSMVVNLAVDRSWSLQHFDGQAALWRFELEFSAGGGPAAPLLQAVARDGGGWRGPDGATVAPGLTLAGASLVWHGLTPVGGALQVSLLARAGGTLKLSAVAEEV